MESPTLKVALAAGGAAGTCVDVILFPLDTLKTRLQSSKGFFASGGFRHVYSGLGPAVLGSAPNAALFFLTYESVKQALEPFQSNPEKVCWHHNMIAASCGETTACLVRVPVEIVKQRLQALSHGESNAKTALTVLRTTLKEEGFLRGLYRGYGTTLLREIPFSLIQFPLWEWLKYNLHHSVLKRPVSAWQSAACGALAGGVSAALTTPLDVAKTWIMLAPADSEIALRNSALFTLNMVYQSKGARGLFAGIIPRTLWISMGGAIFFGVYETVKSLLMQDLQLGLKAS